jgi:hypothetical protein
MVKPKEKLMAKLMLKDFAMVKHSHLVIVMVKMMDLR